jgi:hypothetical protein
MSAILREKKPPWLEIPCSYCTLALSLVRKGEGGVQEAALLYVWLE